MKKRELAFFIGLMLSMLIIFVVAQKVTRVQALDTLSVRDFGAIGDGSDATYAFIRAMEIAEKQKRDLVIPPGDYLITSELPFPNKYKVKGSGYQSNIILKLKSGQYAFKEGKSFRYSFIIEGLRFTIANGASRDVGAFYVESLNRGGCIRDIWTYDLKNPYYFGKQVWSMLVLENIFTYLLSENTADSIAITFRGNTLMARNIEILGKFHTGLKTDKSTLLNLDGFNIGGSTTNYQMTTAVDISDCNLVVIRNGWIEQLDDTLGNGNAKAISIKDSKDIKLDSIHLASGSAYIDNSTVSTENINYVQANSGLRLLNGAKAIASAETLKAGNPNYADGELLVSDSPVISPRGNGKNPILKQGIPLPFSPTNYSFVTLSDDRKDFISGDRAVRVKSNQNYHGINYSATVIPNKLYTAVAVIKVIRGADSVYITPGKNTNTEGNYGFVVKNTKATGYHKLVLPCSSTTATLEFKVIGSLDKGQNQLEYLIDSINLYEDYQPNADPSKLNKKDILITNSEPPASGIWEQGDIVYDDAPTAGGNVGYICISGGNPGTWKGFGLISR